MSCCDDCMDAAKASKLMASAQKSKYAPGTRTLTTMDAPTGADVKVVQTLMGVPVTGHYDAPTAYAVTQWQMRHGVLRDGNVKGYEWDRFLKLISDAS